MNKNELEDFIKQNGDSPDLLIKMAKTGWQKAIAVEFIRQYDHINEIRTNQTWLKYLVTGAFSVTVLAFVAQLIGIFF